MKINTSSEYVDAMNQYNDLIQNCIPANQQLIQELKEATDEYRELIQELKDAMNEYDKLIQKLTGAMNEYELKYRSGNPPPEILANALQDVVHNNLPEVRPAKTVRNKK